MTDVKAKAENAVGNKRSDTEKKTRKPRAIKVLSPADIFLQFQKQQLADKLGIQKLIAEDIAAEKKSLEEQLKLIG